MLKIGFYDNNLSVRGTSVALYQYADYNEKILGNKSIIISRPSGDLEALPKFQKRFDTIFLHNFNSIDYENYCEKNKIDFFYAIKAGDSSDGLLLNNIPTLIHAVFNGAPHGHRFAYISDWLCRHFGFDINKYSIPHMAEKLPEPKYCLRTKLNIPHNNIVYGCYGGKTEFNIKFVHDAIKKIVDNYSNITFIFMNINRFTDLHPNIIHLDATYDLEEKSAFVNACDAMIHARSGGETFGCAVAEFSMCNKPVITFRNSGEKSHLEILDNRAITYDNLNELYDILRDLKTYTIHNDYYKAYDNYSPTIIMKKFKDIFLS